MKGLNQVGFTIIETMLFLGITGLLIAGILFGTGASINSQRYRDSVNSLASLIQDQYSQVSSVINNSNNLSCGASGLSNSVGKFRGQSDCVLLGRLITIADMNITTSTVVGYKSGNTQTGNDISDLSSNYELFNLDSSSGSSTLEWGARISWPVSGNGSQPVGSLRSLSLLLLRSPISGLIYTFSNDLTDTSSATLKSMVVPGAHTPGQNKRIICVDSNGGFNVGLGVLVNSFASSPSSVQVYSSDIDKAANGSTQC